MAIRIDGDHPITSREDDRLGFFPIAQYLARAIVDQPALKGFVFGIEGKWGSGKTTLINLTTAALRAYGPKSPEIVSFSPWLVGDRNELLQTLFDELAIAAEKIDPITDIGQNTQEVSAWRRWWKRTEGNSHWRLRQRQRTKKAIGSKLRAFGAIAGTLGKIARTADTLGTPLAGFAAKVLEQSGEAARSLLAKDSLSKRKDEMVEALSLLSRQIVVFVDDLDRLEPREASEVLRLIRAVADFPNIIYVLSYDPEVVAQILSHAIQVADGAAYLEKIVQVSFRVPRPEEFDLRRWFQTEVRKLFHPHLEIPADGSSSLENRLVAVVDSQGGRYLKTGRDVVRVLNALRLHGLPVLTNIDIADVVWLQLVKIGNPELYSWVERYVAELGAVAGGRGVSISQEARSNLAEQLDNILASEGASLDAAYIELGAILPGLDYEQRSGELHRRLFSDIDASSLAPFVRDKRLGSPQHYRYYFAFSQPAGTVTDQEVEGFIRQAIAAADEAGAKLITLSQQPRPQGGNLGEVLIDRLSALGDKLPAEAVPGIVQILGNVMDTDQLAVPGDFAVRFAWRAAARLLKTLLRKAAAEVRETSVHSLFETGKALGWLTGIIREEIFAHGVYGNDPKHQSDWLLTADEFAYALQVMLDRYRAKPAVDLMKVTDLLSLLYAWLQSGHVDEVKEWVQKQIETDEGLLMLLSRVRGWMNANGIQLYPLKRRDLEQFLDFDSAVQRLQRIAKDNHVPASQRALASELLVASKQDKDVSQ